MKEEKGSFPDDSSFVLCAIREQAAGFKQKKKLYNV